MDCPPVELCAEALGEGLDRNDVGGRLGLTDGLDRSTEGAERLNDGAGRLGLTDGLDRGVEGAERLNDGAGRLGLTDGLDRGTEGAERLNDGAGRLGLTDGLDRCTEGAERLNDGAGRLGATEGVGREGLMDGLGATDRDRLLAMRSRRPPPEKFDLGATVDVLRLVCGLGEDRNEGARTALLRFMVEDWDLICGEGRALGV